MHYIKIDNDMWDDLNKVWSVVEYHFVECSTAVKLILEDPDTKEVICRTVSSNQIEWLEAKDY